MIAGRRNYQRLEIGVRCASQDPLIRGFTRNLSVGGCFIEKSEEYTLLPIGSLISFALEIPGDYAYMEIAGVVRHHGKGEEGMGICFTTTNPGIQSLITQFIQNHLGACRNTHLYGGC